MLYLNDCMAQLPSISDNTIDSIVTDVPYNIGFMGKSWDKNGIAFNIDMWTECLRVLKPGGYLLTFAGTTTYHRIACAIEDAGFTIKPCISWLYSTAMPKGQDIAKAIEGKLTLGSTNTKDFKKLQDEKGIALIGFNKRNNTEGTRPNDYNGQVCNKKVYFTTNEAKEWEGWRTQLCPAQELIVVAQKPLSERTFADNVLKWGTGGLNIDACRIPHNEPLKTTKRQKRSSDCTFSSNSCGFKNENHTVVSADPKGRYPKNVLFDEVLTEYIGDIAKFFYVPKPSKKEKGEGNNHVTCKPIELCRYLILLITPPGGTVLDPFMGSGTTGIAAKREGFKFIGIEKDEHYFEIAKKRLEEV